MYNIWKAEFGEIKKLKVYKNRFLAHRYFAYINENKLTVTVKSNKNVIKNDRIFKRFHPKCTHEAHTHCFLWFLVFVHVFPLTQIDDNNFCTFGHC
jgi:hypothetical protein